MDLIDKCRTQDVPVFLRQWGGIQPKSGGRLIGGNEYRQYPKAKDAASKPLSVDYSKFETP